MNSKRSKDMQSFFQALLPTTVLVCAFFSVNAKADLLVEPYLGYGLGQAQMNYSAGGNLKYNINGVNLGARVAFALPIVYFGLDYQFGTGSGSVKSDSGGSTQSSDFTRSTLYAFVGAHIPLLRAWLGYGLLNNLSFASTSIAQQTTYSGSALKFGAAFTGLPFFDINLEYVVSTFNKYKVGSSSSSLGSGSTFSKASDQTVIISVSMPFDF